jgi:hypothetical protein
MCSDTIHGKTKVKAYPLRESLKIALILALEQVVNINLPFPCSGGALEKLIDFQAVKGSCSLRERIREIHEFAASNYFAADVLPIRFKK